MGFLSFGIADIVLEEANERFAPIFVPSEERLDILKQYCSAIDKILGEFDGQTFEVEVNENDMSIKMTLGISDIEVNKKSDLFNQLTQRSISTKIRSIRGGEGIEIEFIFPSIWERAI